MADASFGALIEQIGRDLKGSWQYRWRALATAAVVCVLGWFAVLAMPDVYEARARVFVDTSSRLRDVLGTIAFQPDIQSRVNVVRQAMLSGPQLERVAETTGLIPAGMTAEERDRLIIGLADAVNVSAGRANISRNMFSISYAHSDRDTAVAVVSELLQSFVDDVIQQKTRGADAAQAFLREQIDHYEMQLGAADSRLADFKRENLGLLPGEGQDYYGQMQTETQSLNQLRSKRAVAVSRRDELRRQLSGETPFLPETSATSTSAGMAPAAATVPGGEIAQRIAQLERSLDDMLLRYTEAHPEVIGAKQQIEQLRRRHAEELRSLSTAEGGVPNATNPVYQRVQIALNEANVEIAAIDAEISDASRRVAEFRSRLDTMPQVEAELARLTRDYTSTKALYDQLVNQLERERLVNEGDDQQVVDFRIIDPPTAGVDPVAPRRTLMLLAVLVFGVGTGGSLAYLMNLIRPVFGDVRQLRSVSGLPVLGSISDAPSHAEATRARNSTLAYSVLAASLIVTAPLLVIFKDPSAAFVQQLFAPETTAAPVVNRESD